MPLPLPANLPPSASTCSRRALRQRSPNPTTRARLCVFLILGITASAAAAHADTSNPVASAAFRDGRDALRSGSYELACAKFRVSEDAEPSSGARLNLGDCALRQGEYVEAEQLYRGAALLAAGEKRAFAEQRALAARAKAGTLRVRWARAKAASGRVEVDGKVIEVPADLAVNPGRHTLRVVASGYDAAPQSVDVADGETAQVDLGMAADAPVVAPLSPSGARPDRVATARRGSRSPVSYVLLGAGGLAIVGGMVTGFVAMGARDDLDAKCSGQRPCAPEIYARDDVRADYDRAKTWAIVSSTCFVAGAVSLVAGGTLWLVTAPSPGGQTLSVAGRF